MSAAAQGSVALLKAVLCLLCSTRPEQNPFKPSELCRGKLFPSHLAPQGGIMPTAPLLSQQPPHLKGGSTLVVAQRLSSGCSHIHSDWSSV